MKILLAIDASAHSKTLVKQFAGRTFAPKTKVRIISAYENPMYVLSVDMANVMPAFYETTFQQALTAAKKATQDAEIILQKKNPSLSISTIETEGSPKRVILAEAEKFGADLIVVGSHGHGEVAGFLLGSVSQAVALHAKCSVEIVRK